MRALSRRVGESAEQESKRERGMRGKRRGKSRRAKRIALGRS